MSANIELFRAELETTSVQDDLPGRPVDRQLPDRDRLARLRGGGPKEQGPHPSLELFDGERLRQIVVGSGVQGSHDLAIFAAGGCHDDRHVADGADHLEQFRAVEVGQAHVEDHDVRRRVDNTLQPVHRGGGSPHFVATIRKYPRNQLADSLLIFDDHDGGHAATVSRRAGLSNSLKLCWVRRKDDAGTMTPMRQRLLLVAGWLVGAVGVRE